MKSLLVLILMLLPTFALAKDPPTGAIYNYKILRVIDGDTVEFEALFLVDPLPKKLSIRVYGVDTPEKSFRAKCPKEAELGARASEFTKNLVSNAKTTQISIYEWDKFGGRVLGDVIIDGNSLTKMLIDNGFAREYYGEAKQSWCN